MAFVRWSVAVRPTGETIDKVCHREAPLGEFVASLTADKRARLSEPLAVKERGSE
jgi:hypothetical protein